MKKIGLVTIGQSPRIDLVPEIQPIVGFDVEIVQKGALDGLTMNEVGALEPVEDDEVLVTRMADGTEVRLAERRIFPLLKKRIKELEDQKIKVIFLACTGQFPPIESTSLIVRPQVVLHHVVTSVAKELKLGVIVPDELQENSAKERWSAAAREVVVESCSPYGDLDKTAVVGERLLKHKVDVVVMDCIGYTLQMKEIVSKSIKKPVLLARSISAKILSELL